MLKEFKLLHKKVIKLEARAREREDTLLELLITLEPFISALPPEVQTKIAEKINV